MEEMLVRVSSGYMVMPDAISPRWKIDPGDFAAEKKLEGYEGQLVDCFVEMMEENKQLKEEVALLRKEKAIYGYQL